MRFFMHHKNTIEVIAANIGAYGIALSDVNQWLTTISLILAISFTIYKFSKEKK